jgi:hypothetical protein
MAKIQSSFGGALRIEEKQLPLMMELIDRFINFNKILDILELEI